MELTKIRRDKLREVISKKSLSVTNINGCLSLDFTSWDTRKNGHTVTIAPDEIVSLILELTKYQNRYMSNSGMKLKVSWVEEK